MRGFVLFFVACLVSAPSLGVEATNRFDEACRVVLARATGVGVDTVDFSVKQQHRRIALTSISPSGEKSTSTVTCLFRDLSDEVPELEAIEFQDQPPKPADAHPEWNEAIWNHFVPPSH